MDRKRCTLALIVVFALSLCKLHVVLAQVPAQGNQNHGAFGNRTLGQPLVPAPSTFGGGIQTAPGGSFLGRSDGSPASATPGLQNSTRVPTPNAAVQPVLNAAVSPQSPAAERDAPELPSITNSAPLSVPKTSGPEGTVRTAPALGLTPGSASPAASPQQPYSRSPELSDRLTQIARSKGMLPGQGIDVYLSNNIALLHGTVRTLSDCVLLAKVLALEPGVRQIDNRLVAFGPTQATARIRAEAKVLQAAGSRGPTAQGPITRQAQTRARPRTRQRNSPVARSRLSIRPRTPRPSLTRLAATPLRSRRAIARTFMKIAPGRSASARPPTEMRSNTVFIRAFTRLSVRTTVGSCTTASCHKRRMFTMTGVELLERALRRSIPLWRIEDELDWQENQGPRRPEDDVRKQRARVVGRLARSFPVVACENDEGRKV